MTDEASSGDDISSIALPADAPPEFSTPSKAAAYYLGLRKQPTAESADDATAEPELPDEGNADPEDPAPGDDKAADPEADKPEPIEPPKSWTKAERERFASLPRETQEYLHAREQERDREFRRSQNDIADQRKAIAAEREAAAKVRQQYEAQLPILVQTLQAVQENAFGDIKTVDDLQKLAAEDPFRYLQWQAHQTKIQAATAELERSKGEQAQAEQARWTEHVQRENELAFEFIPELADKEKGPALTARVAQELLPELGFKPDELAALASGKQKLSIYDHRVQRLLATALKYEDMQKASAAEKAAAKAAVAKAVAKPVPPVQRPGTSKPPGSANSERIQALTKQFNETGSLQIAQELHALKLSQRRAS